MSHYKLSQTTKISFVLGVYNGYRHGNKITDYNGEEKVYTDEEIYEDIIKFIEYHHNEYGAVSFIIKPVRAIYWTGYGCPDDGEVSYELSSIYNPAYGQDPEEWFASVMLYAKKLSQHYNQTTCTVTIEGYENKPVQICYLVNEQS